MTRPTGPCLECGRNRRGGGRGLCASCLRLAHADGTYLDYPRLTRPRQDTVEDWLMLRAQGFTRKQAADRLGMTYAAFDRALQRAARAGDTRLGGAVRPAAQQQAA